MQIRSYLIIKFWAKMELIILVIKRFRSGEHPIVPKHTSTQYEITFLATIYRRQYMFITFACYIDSPSIYNLTRFGAYILITIMSKPFPYSISRNLPISINLNPFDYYLYLNKKIS